MAFAFLVDADEKRFDQQSVVENDGCRGGHLLIGQVVVLDAGEAGFVAVVEHPVEFVACGPDAAGGDERRIAEIDDPHFAALLARHPGCFLRQHLLERVTGIEPAYSAWEADVLPLNYTRIDRPLEVDPCDPPRLPTRAGSAKP